MDIRLEWKSDTHTNTMPTSTEKFAEIEERLSFKDEGFEFELKGLKKERERERDEKLLPRSLSDLIIIQF